MRERLSLFFVVLFLLAAEYREVDISLGVLLEVLEQGVRRLAGLVQSHVESAVLQQHARSSFAVVQ